MNAEPDKRNRFGFPRINLRASESSAQRNHIDNSRRVNESLPWIIIAVILGALSLGLVIANMVQQPQITDAKIDARMAEVKAIANVGREHGRIALSEVERANAELAAKGLIRKSEH